MISSRLDQLTEVEASTEAESPNVAPPCAMVIFGAAGRIIGMKTFGASAPLKELQRKFGFEPERIVATAVELLGRR